MASINLDLDYFDHPKTDRLVLLLGRGAESIPPRLWCFVGKHFYASGRMTALSTQEIEKAVKWRGEPGKAVKALVTCGFLEVVDGEYQVHDWLDHARHLAVYKERARAAAKARWHASSISDASSIDASSMPADASSNACACSESDSVLLKNSSSDKTNAPKRARFVPPSLEEVSVYCAERAALGKPRIDPEAFIAHYEACGWVQGRGKPIKNWRAAIWTWEKGREEKAKGGKTVQELIKEHGYDKR